MNIKIKHAALLTLASLWSVASLAQSQNYIIRFKDSALTAVKPGSVRDDRVAQDPDHWAYVGERVLGHIQTLEKKHGLRANAAYGQVFKGMSATLSPGQLETLRRDPSVDLIEAEQAYKVPAVSAAGKTNGGGGGSVAQILPWGITQTLANTSYTLAGNGSGAVSGVRIYVIDTGVDMKNADLNRSGHVNFMADGRNTDCNGHGTHVAGTMAAIDNSSTVVGMAPGAAVYGVKVLGCDGSGTTTSVIKGLDWVAANAVKPAVANMSLGGGASQLLDDAVRSAAGKGILFAIAAGNESANACNTSPARVGGGSTAGVLVTAASDASNVEPSFSNFGSCVDIWAPGVNVTSLKPGGGTALMSGTSMASPHVGGAAALYLGRYPTASQDAVTSYLRQTSKPTGTFSKDGRSVMLLQANVQ